MSTAITLHLIEGLINIDQQVLVEIQIIQEELLVNLQLQWQIKIDFVDNLLGLLSIDLQAWQVIVQRNQ